MRVNVSTRTDLKNRVLQRTILFLASHWSFYIKIWHQKASSPIRGYCSALFFWIKIHEFMLTLQGAVACDGNFSRSCNDIIRYCLVNLSVSIAPNRYIFNSKHRNVCCPDCIKILLGLICHLSKVRAHFKSSLCNLNVHCVTMCCWIIISEALDVLYFATHLVCCQFTCFCSGVSKGSGRKNFHITSLKRVESACLMNVKLSPRFTGWPKYLALLLCFHLLF